MHLLAADIGGTKTNLAIYPIGGDPAQTPGGVLLSQRFFSRFDQIILTVLKDSGLRVDSICMGIAGPIFEGRVQVTNLPWVIDQADLQLEFAFQRVILLNDLEAIASAVPILEPEDLTVINQGVPDLMGAIAVIAPGTGLGEAYLTWDGMRYMAHPSEGGHADFAPTNSEEQQLLDFLRERFDHVSYERICSGMGIPNIFDFLVETGRYQSPPWLIEEFSRSQDLTPVIVRAALDPDRPCEICREALSRFISILGSEAGNLALKVLATGGVYLAGGIPPKISPALVTGNFMEAFSRKGRFSVHMRKMPVYLIHNENSALLGAANYGLNYTGG